MMLRAFSFDIFCHHRLISNTLTHEQNCKTYGKCMGKEGHGHNYKIRILYKVNNLENDFKFYKNLETKIITLLQKPFSYKSLNKEFLNHVSNPITSGEQIALVFQKILLSASLNPHLHSLEVVETRKNSFFVFF